MAFCKSCGSEVNEGKFCVKCGTPVEEVAVMSQDQLVQGQTVVSDQAVVQGQAAPATKLPSDGMGIAGFVCGLIGFLCCTYVAIPGLILSILSMQNVKRGKVNPSTKWMGIVGLIFSILGIVFLIINIVGIVSGTNDVYNSIINR